MVELSGPAVSAQPQFAFRQESSQDPRKLYKKELIPDSERNPDPIPGQSGGIRWSVQPFKAGGGYVVAWLETKTGDLKRLLWTVDYFTAGQPDSSRAVALLTGTRFQASAAFAESHRQWWRAWWPQGFLSIPDTRLESFYWIQMYKLASATRADRPAIDLMGPWFRSTPWPKIWWNLNLQLTYWPVYGANRLDIGESLMRMLDAGTSNLIANVPAAWREDSAGIGRTSSYDCRGGAGSELGNLTWTLHNYWLQCRYSGDDALLRERFYPLLKRAAQYLVHNLRTGPDGLLHFPADTSPEYPERAPDSNYNLALLRWALTVLLATNERFLLRDPQAAAWRETLAKLVPYPADDKQGYHIGAGVPLAQSHRHFSHLLMFYPLHTADPDDPAERVRLEKSLDHWIGFEGALQGYSFTGASAMSSWLRRKEAAVSLLSQFLDRYVKANTMYLEAGPVIETPLAGAASVQEILLQSATPNPFAPLIRVFPAVPDSWPEVTIHRLRTEGAFLVSARRRGGQTRFIQVTSLAGTPCQIETGWATPPLVQGARAFQVRNTQDRAGRPVTVIDLKQGETATLLPAGAGDLADLVVEPVAAQPSRMNYFGSVKPRLVAPEASGRLVLSASDAVLNGTTLMFEKKHTNGNLGRWITPGEFASWQVQIPKPGAYQVALTYSATGGGKPMRITGEMVKARPSQTIGPLDLTTRSTSGWEKYETHAVGRLEFKLAGRYDLKLSGRGETAPFINLQQIELVP